jgi:CheY-like chemotaxis protein
MPTRDGAIRALAVDDHPDTAESLACLLEQLGCNAAFVTEPARALEVAASTKAEIIFVDIAMPGIDGVALARMLRERHAGAVFLVAMTAYSSTYLDEKIKHGAFDAYMRKPVEIAGVEALLATMRASRR